MQTLFIIILGVFVVSWLANRMGGRGIAQVGPVSVRDMVEKEGAAVLDVRTPREFGDGHIRGAVSFPLSEMRNRIDELAPLKEKRILVYCLTGNRSMTACRILRQNGFTRAANLRGGLRAWARHGFTLSAS
jgi:rhodanese-related sulfurtransferase